MLTGHFPRLMAVVRSKGDQAQASESLFNRFLEHFILNTGEGLEDVRPLPPPQKQTSVPETNVSRKMWIF